jgi:hypothetical protein
LGHKAPLGFFYWSLPNAKTPGARNCLESSGLFPLSGFVFRPHPEINP